jgi:hypothetical protein
MKRWALSVATVDPVLSFPLPKSRAANTRRVTAGLVTAPHYIKRLTYSRLRRRPITTHTIPTAPSRSRRAREWYYAQGNGEIPRLPMPPTVSGILEVLQAFGSTRVEAVENARMWMRLEAAGWA